MSDTPPIACTPGVLNDDENQGREALIETLRQAVLSLSFSDHGLAVKLHKSKETVLAAARLAAFESLCCPFLSIRLRIDPGEAPLALEMIGPSGSGEVLRTELGL